jgi:membrane-associated phospholipid phosphatase
MLFLLFFALLFLLLWGVFTLLVPVIQHALAAVASRTARLRNHDYLPVAAMLAGGLIVTFIAGDGFLDLAELVHQNSPNLQYYDRDVHDWATTTRSPGATAFFTAMTTIGAPWFLGVVTAVVGFVLAMRRRWRWLAYLIFTTCGGSLIVLELKVYFARARPDLAEALRRAHGYSFPSGHSMGSMIVFGALSYLAYRAGKSWRVKAAAIAAAATLISAIALSRVYLGVHWISDVGAGIAAGFLWVTMTTLAYETSRRIRALRARRVRKA